MSEYGPFDADDLVRWAENYGHPETWAKKAQQLHGQNEALREAFQRILDHGETHDEPCWALHNGDCADVFREIARSALRVKGV